MPRTAFKQWLRMPRIGYYSSVLQELKQMRKAIPLLPRCIPLHLHFGGYSAVASLLPRPLWPLPPFACLARTQGLPFDPLRLSSASPLSRMPVCQRWNSATSHSSVSHASTCFTSATCSFLHWVSVFEVSPPRLDVRPSPHPPVRPESDTYAHVCVIYTYMNRRIHIYIYTYIYIWTGKQKK